jgi:hypothetical protein
LHLTGKDKHRFRVKGWKKIFQAKEAGKQEGMTTLMADRTHFRPKLAKRDKESHFILTKEQSIRRK